MPVVEDLDAREQLMIELVNRARLNPLAEAARFGIDLNEGLPPGTLDGAVRQPVAGNLLLSAAAAGHSAWMLQANVFSHDGENGSTAHERMEAAGYVFTGAWTSGENLAWVGSSLAVDAEAAVVNQHENLFLSPGHRQNLLNDVFREIGIGQELGPFVFEGFTYNSSMVTQNYAVSGNDVFLTGVAYDDANGNDFYDVGEGQAGVSFDIASYVASSASAGGYALGVVVSGIETVRITRPEGVTEITVDFAVGNVKLDVVDGSDPVLKTSGNTTLLEPVDAQSLMNLEALGGRGLTLTGNSGVNTLRGGVGQDTLIGLGGDDFIFGGEGRSDLRDVVYAGDGNDSVDGGYGNDELRGDAGNDSMEGGFGVDILIGGDGQDVLTGSAWSDEIYGGNDSDFINGGFGHDRVNGGAGGDRFYHLGIFDHGSDWIQDFTAAEGDVLLYGQAATRSQFQVNFTETANAGAAGVDEAFVIFRPTGQILWALVDGGALGGITLMLDGVGYDLLS